LEGWGRKELVVVGRIAMHWISIKMALGSNPPAIPWESMQVKTVIGFYYAPF
jgi:hypothetical protein